MGEGAVWLGCGAGRRTCLMELYPVKTPMSSVLRAPVRSVRRCMNAPCSGDTCILHRQDSHTPLHTPRKHRSSRRGATLPAVAPGSVQPMRLLPQLGQHRRLPRVVENITIKALRHDSDLLVDNRHRPGFRFTRCATALLNNSSAAQAKRGTAPAGHPCGAKQRGSHRGRCREPM